MRNCDDALALAEHGLAVFPLRPREKRPLNAGWQDEATANVSALRLKWTSRGASSWNVGVATGRPSSVVVLDVDAEHLDRGALDELERRGLPETATVETPGGGLHLYFRIPEEWGGDRFPCWRTEHFEVKGDGAYVVAPGSVHPNGGVYRWRASPDEVAIAPAPGWLLDEARRRLERRRSPTDAVEERPKLNADDARAEAGRWLSKALDRAAPGNRNGTGFWLACQLRDCDVPYAVAEETMRTYAHRVPQGDHPYTEREALASLDEAYSTPAREPARAPAASPTVGEPTDKAASRRPIVISTDMTAVVDAAEDALLESGVPIYQRAGALVRVIKADARTAHGIERQAGAPIVAAVPHAHLRELIATAANWQKVNTKGETSAALPPEWAVEALAARGRWKFAALKGVLTTPTIRADGSLLAEPGYDRQTGFLLLDGPRIENIPEKPTRRDAQEAARSLLDDVFGDFPFADKTDKAATLAALLTLVALPAIQGPMPMFGVTAPVAGSGKTLLVDALTAVATGQNAARMAEPKDDDEMRKRIFALAFGGDTVALLDNIERPFQSSALCAALTGRVVKDRVLGKSEMMTLRLDTVFFVTGNNLRMRGDLARRLVPIRLDPRVADPEERTGFRHPNLLEHVRRERPRFVRHALVILRAFYIAGRPRQDAKPFGSFEAWDALIRHAALWATGNDPLAGREAVKADDPEREALTALLTAWADVIGTGAENAVTVRGAVELAGSLQDEEGALKAALADISGGDPERFDGRRIGYVLRRFQDRIVRNGDNGLVLRRGERGKHGYTWFAERV